MGGLSERTIARMIARGQTQEIREDVKRERGNVAAVKVDRRDRLAGIAAQCGALRAAHTTDAKRQRAELRAAIQAARELIRDKCKATRGEAEEVAAAKLIDAIAELDEVRDRLRLHLAGIKLPPKDAGRVRGGLRGAEKQSEMIDQVANDIEGIAPELVPVWRNMARRMPRGYRETKHRSAFEGFLEWAEQNRGDVAEIQDRLLGRSVAEWEEREVEEQRAVFDEREAKRERDHRKLVRLTEKGVRKLDAETALDRYEAVTAALQQEADDIRLAALRRTSGLLHDDLVRRGLFDQVPEADAEDDEGVPF